MTALELKHLRVAPSFAAGHILARHGRTERQEVAARNVTLHAHQGGRGAARTQYFLSVRTPLRAS